MADGKPPREPERAAIIAALPRLRRFCWALAGNASDGEDLMQAAVERALSRIDQFEAGTRMDSWLFRIARNLRIDGARSQMRRGSPVSLDDLPEREARDATEMRGGHGSDDAAADSRHGADNAATDSRHGADDATEDANDDNGVDNPDADDANEDANDDNGVDAPDADDVAPAATAASAARAADNPASDDRRGRGRGKDDPVGHN
jgi:DNA-directed RNA polymerase specialized sigma24 family protein